MSSYSYNLFAGIWPERKYFANLALAGYQGAGWKFQNGIRGETMGNAPWPEILNQFAYPALAIEINKVNGEPHANRVNALARDNPQPSSWRQALLPQQALSAAFAGKSLVYAAGDRYAARFVGDGEPGSRGARRGRPRVNSTASEHDPASLTLRVFAGERR